MNLTKEEEEVLRDTGKRALATPEVLSGKQITQWEEVIFDRTSSEREYKRAIFQTVGDLIDGTKPTAILACLKRDKVGWKHKSWGIMAHRVTEQNEFLVNPFEVEEGVFECKARDGDGKVCGSKKVFSYSRQDRSCDEGTSVYCQCTACGTRWRERG